MKRTFIVLSTVGMQVLLCTVGVRFISAAGPQEVATTNWSIYGISEGLSPADSLCGVMSVYIVAREFGFDNSYEAVLAKMPPGIYGNTMKQIVEYFRNNFSLQVIPIRCNAKELYRELSKANDQRAIINLNDHWVVVRDVTDDTFEIIDFPRKYFMPIDAIDNLWEGHTVIIRRQSSSSIVHRYSIRILFFLIFGVIMIILHTWIFAREKRESE
ncbi:MAG: hypothetical protein GWN00_26350 [Aliifodinibius sp.]|nr:hypothetical protein [Fodinibius sp.]NIV14375.1 hypothetical protein [Fodinibius sp.]NIY28194.1 hypothetical protein [Fodinibius sp.]